MKQSLLNYQRKKMPINQNKIKGNFILIEEKRQIID